MLAARMPSELDEAWARHTPSDQVRRGERGRLAGIQLISAFCRRYGENIVDPACVTVFDVAYRSGTGYADRFASDVELGSDTQRVESSSIGFELGILLGLTAFETLGCTFSRRSLQGRPTGEEW